MILNSYLLIGPGVRSGRWLGNLVHNLFFFFASRVNLQLLTSVSSSVKQGVDFNDLQDPAWKKQWPVQCPVLHCGSFVTNSISFQYLKHVKSYFPFLHKHFLKIPVKIKLDWPPRTSQLIKMIWIPLCLTVSTLIGTFHSKGLEKPKNRAKVYIVSAITCLLSGFFLSPAYFWWL